MKNKILGLSIFILTIFIVYIVVGFLDKGLVFNDEAYYLFHFRDFQKSLTFDRTNFYRIFHIFFSENLYHFRIITLFLLSLSNYFLCYVLFDFFKINYNRWHLSIIGILISFTSWGAANIALQQYIGNTILIGSGLSFLILAMKYNYRFLLISGFILSFILFNGNTHIITLIPITLLIFFYYKKEFKKLSLFFIGLLFGIVFYFSFLDTIENFFYQIDFLKEYMKFHIKQHPKRYYLKWILEIVFYSIFPTLMVYFLIKKGNANRSSLRKLEIFIISICTLSLLFKVFQLNFIWSVFFVMTIHLMVLKLCFDENLKIENKAIILILLLVPYGLSLGSMIPFFDRVHSYIIFYIVIFVIYIFSTDKSKSLWSLLFLFYLTISSFFLIKELFSKEKGWKNFSFSEQTEKVMINGHPIFLDKEKKEGIENLRPYLFRQDKVIYSDNRLLGYLYVLEATPPIHYYFTVKDYIDYIINLKKTKPDDYIYIESSNYPFSNTDLKPLKFVKNPENYTKVLVGEFTVYLPKNFKTKY